MGSKASIMDMKFPSLPETHAAIELLQQICSSEPAWSPRSVDKPLILYGAGNLGKMAKEYFDRLAIPVFSVVDANSANCAGDPFWSGVTITGPEDVSVEQKQNSLLAVCVATAAYAPLACFLRRSGWADVAPFYDIAEAYRSVHPLGNGWFAGVLSQRDREGIETVLCAWDDDVSRAHHLQLLAWRALREEWLFCPAPVTTTDRYFIPEVKSLLTSCESFLDVGAYHGETTLRFLREIGREFEKVWAVEPDRLNLAILMENLANLPTKIRKRIIVLTTAVASSAGERRFYEGLGYASQLSTNGRNSVEVQRVDDLGVAPSYIKLHLEGAELDALKGAKTTIHRHRPIIAATSYHNALGLWELPFWLMETMEEYRFSMRLHSWCGTGAVIYCVPRERYDAAGVLHGDI